jgi:hypothetical protein
MGLSQKAFAQTRGFSREPEIFIKELGGHVKKNKDKVIDETFEKLRTRWDEGVFSEDQQSFVMRTSEYMMLKKFKINPDFQLFMLTLIEGSDSTISEELFDNWLQQSYSLIKKSKRSYLKLLQASYGIFKEQALYIDKSKKWIFTGSDYSFKISKKSVKIIVSITDLHCQGPEDEIIIYNTSGVYEVLKNSWSGKNGTVNWERVKIPQNLVFASFKDYNVDMRKGELHVDTALFKYVGIIDEALYGSLSDKISSGQTSKQKSDFSTSSYPRFISFRHDLPIASFAKGRAKYLGGFAISGAKIQGKGSKENPASFEFYYESKEGKKLVVKTVSKNYLITDKAVKSENVAATIYTDSGTIYHPMIKMNFVIEQGILILTRGKDGIEQSPFFDTDHQLELWVDQVKWKLDEPILHFDMLLNEAKASFESKNYFREYNYDRIRKGIMAYHPLTKIHKYATTYKTKKFSLSDYAFDIGSKRKNLLHQMYMLTDGGFIYYDEETDSIEIKEKLFNYVLNHYKLKDYDVIKFTSVIGAVPNARLNLINYDLELEGVSSFHFSDSQYVVVIPRDQKVTIKNNRTAIFDGKITAGRFDFYGRDFRFDYENFLVESTTIDSMRLFYPDKTNDDFLLPVKSVLRDLHGTLYIDKPSNKSGLKDYPAYPRFESRGPSLIAYDKKGIHNGAYKKDIFHFAVKPFTIDSMDNFTIEGLAFPGTFVSAGILPEFDFEARIMDDYSLGFTRATPPGGYQMYGGKGHGNIDVSMSDKGFWAKGEIDFNGAKLSSSKIVMMPDSTNAEVDEYKIDKNKRYPRLLALDVLSHWMPKSDSMIINTKGHDVDVFTDGQVFKGNLVQTPQKLSGNGLLAWDNARLTSNDIQFSPNKADAEVALITIGDIDAELISFASNNVNAHVDFDVREADFIANELGNLTDFPVNQFASSMDEYHWDMDAETILLSKGNRLKPEDAFFVTKHPHQQGLKFQSTKALFDMKTATLHIEEIPHIDIADSRLFPLDGKATIFKGANVDTFRQAKFLASRENKFHDLYDMTAKVLGRNTMNANAFYRYKDKHETNQEIHFTKIFVDNDTHVVANGYMFDSIGFTVSPKIAYKGNVKLLSTEQLLKFNGYVKPLHTFEDYPSAWFRYEQQPDPKNVIIPAGNPKNENRRSLAVAVSMAPVDSVNIYPTFFNFKRVYSDIDITSDTGVMYYDEENQAFKTGNEARLLENARKGNYLVFNEKTRMIESGGRLDFNLNVHDNFNVITAGKIFKHEDDTTFSAEAMMGFNIKLPAECYTRLHEVIAKNGEDAPAAKIDQELVKSAVAEFLSDKQFKKVLKNIEDVGEINSTGDLNRDFLISKAKFHYSPLHKALISTEPIEIANIKGKVINKKLNARMMIERKRSATRIVLYFEVTKYDWFYFDFYRGNLYVSSTDKEFNDAIVQKGHKLTERGYVIRPASPRSVNKTLDKIEF